MKLEKRKIILILACLVSLMCFFPANEISAKADIILEPHILTTGDKNNQLQAKTYSFTADGKSLIPLQIPENGSVAMQMHVENGAYININMYNTSTPTDSTLPTVWSCQCTGDIGNQGTTMRYFDKGTYYLRFPANTYRISLVFYANRSKTIKSGNAEVAYADYHHPVYYTYKASNNGFVTISTSSFIDTTYLPEVTLCDSKKKPITDPKCNHESTDTIVYAVKKNTTYQIKVTSKDSYGSQYYSFLLNYTARTEKSGNVKSKAVSIQLGKDTSGLVFAEDKTSSEDWYKVKISKKQKVVLYYSGSITSGSMLFDVYDAKGNPYASYSVVANVDTHEKDSLSHKGEGRELSKGTYYIRIKKTRKSASGIYTIRLAKARLSH